MFTTKYTLAKICTYDYFTLYRYYIGQQAYILITDLDMLKQILVKDFDNFSDHAVSRRSTKD